MSKDNRLLELLRKARFDTHGVEREAIDEALAIVEGGVIRYSWPYGNLSCPSLVAGRQNDSAVEYLCIATPEPEYTYADMKDAGRILGPLTGDVEWAKARYENAAREIAKIRKERESK